MPKKILIEEGPLKQFVASIGDGGGYFGTGTILWDEAKDGPIPAITLGAMVRQGSSLVADPAKVAAIQTQAKADDDAKAQKEKDKQDRKTRLQSLDAAILAIKDINDVKQVLRAAMKDIADQIL